MGTTRVPPARPARQAQAAEGGGRPDARRSYRVPSVQRAMLIIQQLAGQREGRSLGELCRLLGMPKSTAYGILSTLQAGEFVRRDPVSERYRLSHKILEIGGAYAESLDLVQEFLPVARTLVADVNESVHLAVLDGREVIHISGVDSNRPHRLQSYTGTRLPATCTALGKVLLAALDDAELELRFGHEPLPRLTDASLRTFAELHNELQLVRLRGIAYDHQESTPGVSCVAAPVLGPQGVPLAAMSFSALSQRLDVGRLAQIEDHLREGALRVSRSLGYRGGAAGPRRGQAPAGASRLPTGVV